MPLQGTLQETNATQVLNLISLAHKSGMLTIYYEESHKLLAARQQEPLVARLAFKAGQVLWASLTRQENDLVSLLGKYEKLPQERARALKNRADSGGDKALAILMINAGYVARRDIVYALRKHIIDVTHNVMTWRSGRFLFEDLVPPPTEAIPIAIDLTPILSEDAKILREQAVIEKAIPSLDYVLKLPADSGERLAQMDLTKEQWRVVSSIDGKRSVRQLAAMNNLSDLQVRRIVYDMIKARVVRLIDPSEIQPEKDSSVAKRKTMETSQPTQDVQSTQPLKLVTQAVKRITQNMRRIDPNDPNL